MASERKKAFDSICRYLAVMKVDLSYHQTINDLSLNIHAENYFRDVFNFVFNKNFENANFFERSAKSIDLVDHKAKKAIQITTTKTSDKIYKTFDILKRDSYSDYAVEVYYLLEKPKPNSSTKDKFFNEYGVDLDDVLKSDSDFISEIENLETNRLIELSEKYFNKKVVRYTDDAALELACRQLISDMPSVTPSFIIDYNLVDPPEKISINKVSERVSNEIIRSLDYTFIIDHLEDQEIEDVKYLIFDVFYRNILIKNLKKLFSKEELKALSVNDLQILAVKQKVDFSPILVELYLAIKDRMMLKDFNSLDHSWIIISYFFEICDIGVKETYDSSK